MIVTAYDPLTGKVTSIVELSEASAGLQSFSYIEGEADPSTQYVDLETLALTEYPPKPDQENGGAYSFDFGSMMWVCDAQILDLLHKNKRTSLLAKSDWTQLPDVPLATKESWAIYRQALRDITSQPGYPFEITWPEALQ